MDNQQTIQKINAILQSTPLIYFSREAERALGLEKTLSNYHICCVEDSYIVDQLINSGVSVFSLERELKQAGLSPADSSKSTASLLSHEKTIEWIKKITGGNKFYALTFFPAKVVDFKINKLGGELLNNPYELNLRFENKLSQADILESYKVSIPKYKNIVIDDLNFGDLVSEYGSEFVIQTEKSHTGNGTFFINSEENFLKLRQDLSGNKIKVSEKIDGKSFTLNVCINKERIYIGALQYQITGIPGATGTEGVTIGNDFSFGTEFIKTASQTLLQNLVSEISKVGQLMITEKYRGLFGLDLIIKDDNVYIIEINARQTANIALQTKLELLSAKQIPQMLIHIAEFLNVDISSDLINYAHLSGVFGSQIFVRALYDDQVINEEVKSGVYRLQSDNSANDWTKGTPEINKDVIFLDEEMDKPLIHQSDAYSIDTMENGFLILSNDRNKRKNKFDEILRIQFKEGIISSDGKIVPWVLEMYKYFAK